MCSKWKVTLNLIGGDKMYAVYRLRDAAAVVHAGNMEFATGYMDDKQEAVAIAERLNQEMEEQTNE
ncbi:MAG: hypothetical protein RR064_05680 [Oscillospiraceae bacterium]